MRPHFLRKTRKFKPVTAADISVATNDEQQVIKAIEAKCQDIKDRAMGGGMPGDNFGNETQDPNFSNGPESMPGGQINSVNSSGGPQNGEIDPLELEGDDNDTSGYLPLGFE